ncbi:hypothetical protein MHB50_07015 [Siminovitchia sp. FSL H7-0308]|uniref:ElaB/YqjD/DUF883 family membrane-anchored ribosome-binding protein n=1 Tax=Siminovitchia thermophila TaxID=1245522 RepID=A0ABS2R9I5_9BACI|nr:hypothetical protein [Siminovitchia thermophila]MBM7716305.1 ElaB/YqjD/DUF883 family membrane-anchored ribosome-binding protein [Siminovitchia thermophila]ONK24203.1 hypothetical protein BLX87_06930 [Bacillus sp. VT-16-64]
MEQFLPIIIIAIISFLLNSKKKNQPQRQKADQHQPIRPVQQKPARPNTDLEERSNSNERMDEENKPFQVDMPRSLREAADILLTQIETNPAIEEEKARAEGELEKLKKQAETYEQKIRAAQKRAADHADTFIPKKAKPSEQRPLFGHQNDIVRGMIMHEILGPPKALKRRVR